MNNTGCLLQNMYVLNSGFTVNILNLSSGFGWG